MVTAPISTHAIRLGLAALLIACAANPLRAEEAEAGIPFSVGPLDLRATLDVGAGAFSVRNAQFGGRTNSRFNKPEGGRTWYEGFAHPGLEFEWPGEGMGSVYGRVSAVGAATRGQGEAGATATTSDRPEHAELEHYFVGWKSGSVFDGVLPSDAIDLSVGNQDFLVGDGFLIANGTLDGGGRGAYFLGPRAAFEKTAILRLNTQPVRADVFHIAGVVDQDVMHGADNPETKLYGANVEWFASKTDDKGRFEYEERKWYVGLTALKVYDADRTFSFAGSQGGGTGGSNRDGLQVWSARFGGSFIPGLDDFSLFGEYGIERNGAGANGGKVRADAWYLQPQYEFGDLPWSPTLTARYAHFSGDPNTGDTVDRSWDPLFSDAGPRGGNTWTQGLIFAQYVGSNSNLNSWYVGLEAEPLKDTLSVGIALYRHDFAEPSGATAVSRHLMDEVDVFAEWQTPVPGLVVAPAVAMGRAGAGERQSLGLSSADDRTIWLGQIVLSYSL